MVTLHASGLSPTEIGKQIGFCADTIRNCLQERQTRLS